jgi:RHS repeat-associated protein
MVAFAENKFALPAGASRLSGLRDRRVLCGKKYHPQYSAETENYYVRNRYYAPVVGRWLTRDPIGTDGRINLYAYVGSSPVGNVDACGTNAWTDAANAVGQLDAEEGGNAFNNLIGSGPYGKPIIMGPDSPDIPYSPEWGRRS